ncbi:putative helicase [Candidatus Paraburkholderia kirkii]|nr:putative helicase [Candidatus Paraburkholderia kirkii]
MDGTQSYPYKVDIAFKDNRPHGYCTCPVGYACKHVATMLLACLEEQEQSSRSGVRMEVERWISDFRAKVLQAQETNDRAAKRPAGTTYRILYVLVPAAHPEASVELLMLKARLGVDGTIHATETWYPSHAAWSSPPRFVTQEDDVIVRALRTERDHSSDRFLLLGKKGAAVWPMMLATGRLYFEPDPFRMTLEHPLREGSRRRADIEWIPHADDMIFPSLETKQESGIVLPTEPPWYVDPSTNETGAVDAPIPDELIADYLKMSVLTLKEAAIVHAALQAFAPATELDVAVLDFDYGGVTIPASSPEVLVQLADGELARIARRTDVEKACVERLGKAGLKTISGAPASRDASPCAGGFFMPAPAAWHTFVDEHVPALREAGWRIVIESNSRFDLVEIEQIDTIAHAAGDGWFDLELGITVDQERVCLEPVLAELFARDRRWLSGAIDAIDATHAVEFRTTDGRRFVVRAARIKPLVRTLIDLFEHVGWNADTPLRLATLEAGRLPASDEKLRWQFDGDASVVELARRLRNAAAPRRIAPPRGLTAKLRDYQREGVDWMQFLRKHDLAGVLADDMGLGRTVQTLAHILTEKEAGRFMHPALIVVPTTLVNNWLEEARRFAPTLRVLDLHGPLRHERFARIAEHQMVITTYPLVWRDCEALAQHDYHLLILDEAQYVKNAASKAASVIRTLRARHRLCLTGTPLENHLGELWSQFDFLLPGFLGTQKEFAARWRKPIEKLNDQTRRDLLARRIRPFMLRRRKDEVATELPPKTTIVRSVELESAQRDLYETVRAAMQKKVRDAIEKQGFARSRILMLDALLKLRQVCCDPSLVKLPGAKKAQGSAKLALLLEMLPSLVEEGRRVLVFSQFTGYGHARDHRRRARRNGFPLHHSDGRYDRSQDARATLFRQAKPRSS